MAPFVYDALRENEIRLVDIFPAGGNEEQIEIILSTANSSRCPAYRLLTYTRGNPEERRIVKCNGHEIQLLQTVILLFWLCVRTRASQHPSGLLRYVSIRKISRRMEKAK
jgi:hypothetical protein